MDGRRITDERRQIWLARFFMALPLLVPASIYGLHLAGIVGPGYVLGVLASSAAIGGIPYLVLLVIGYAKLRHRPAADYRWWAVRFPLLFVPFLVLFMTVTQLLGRPRSAGDVFALLIFAVATALPLGYAYVALYLLSSKLLRGSSHPG